MIIIFLGIAWLAGIWLASVVEMLLWTWIPIGAGSIFAAMLLRRQDTGMMAAVNFGTGQPIALARIDGKDRPALFTWNWTIKFTAFIIYTGSTAY